MTNAITIPCSTRIAAIPEGPARAQYVYVDGKRTETPRTNDAGQPLFAFTALVHADVLGGTVGGVRVSTPVKALPDLAFGEALTLVDPVLTIRNTDSFDLAISIEASGFEEPEGRSPRSLPNSK